MAIEDGHDVQLGHADAQPDELLAADAAQLRHRAAEVGDDTVLDSVVDRGGTGDIDTSLHMNYHIDADYLVNRDH